MLGVGGLLIGGWAIGALASDRWWWSQWLSWMTPLSITAGCLFAAAGSLALRWTRGTQASWVIASVVGGLLFAGSLVGHQAEMSSGLRILQWTSGPVLGDPSKHGSFIATIDPDIAIIEGGTRIARSEAFRTWNRGGSLAMRGPVLIASRRPIKRLRTIAWAEGIMLILLEVDAGQNEPLQILIADFPSDPRRARAQVAATAARLLQELPHPTDLMLGDFNMTQNSSSLRSVISGWAPVWPAQGVGWGGTWPRPYPIYRLDHVLVPEDRQSGLTVTTIDPGCGRHRAQLISVTD